MPNIVIPIQTTISTQEIIPSKISITSEEYDENEEDEDEDLFFWKPSFEAKKQQVRKIQHNYQNVLPRNKFI